MKFPRFSIIMCIKNGEKFINEQIESIINQDFKNWQLYIIDDCSIDNSFKIAQKYQKMDKRIDVKKNKTNLGVKNNFLKNSYFLKGEWIVFCDQDDIWKINKLSCLNFYINANSGFNLFLHNGCYLVNKNKTLRGAFGEIVDNYQKVYKSIPDFKFLNLLIKNRVIGCFICVKKEFLNEFVKITPKANIYHDHWIALITSIYSRIFFINQDLISYRRHEHTNTKTKKILNKIFDRLLIVYSLFLNHLKIKMHRKLKV